VTPTNAKARAPVCDARTKMNTFSREPITRPRLRFKLVRVEHCLTAKRWEKLRRRCLWQPRRMAA
jgi:hypothetical protein